MWKKPTVLGEELNFLAFSAELLSFLETVMDDKPEDDDIAAEESEGITFATFLNC